MRSKKRRDIDLTEIFLQSPKPALTALYEAVKKRNVELVKFVLASKIFGLENLLNAIDETFEDYSLSKEIFAFLNWRIKKNDFKQQNVSIMKYRRGTRFERDFSISAQNETFGTGVPILLYALENEQNEIAKFLICHVKEINVNLVVKTTTKAPMMGRPWTILDIHEDCAFKCAFLKKQFELCFELLKRDDLDANQAFHAIIKNQNQVQKEVQKQVKKHVQSTSTMKALTARGQRLRTRSNRKNKDDLNFDQKVKKSSNRKNKDDLNFDQKVKKMITILIDKPNLDLVKHFKKCIECGDGWEDKPDEENFKRLIRPEFLIKYSSWIQNEAFGYLVESEVIYETFWLQNLVENAQKIGIDLGEINRSRSTELMETAADSTKDDLITYMVETLKFVVTEEMIATYAANMSKWSKSNILNYLKSKLSTDSCKIPSPKRRKLN